MINYLPHTEEIIDNYSGYFFKKYMKESWGINTSCPDQSPWLVWYEEWMLEWQRLEDCCELCTKSKDPKPIVVTQLPVAGPCPTFPVIQVNYCKAGCTYAGGGDFNTDFSGDFFK